MKPPRLKMLGSKVKTLDTRSAKPLPKEVDPHYRSAGHEAWRKDILDRAGWRCEWVENGRRCEKRSPAYRMIADHIEERADGGADFGEGAVSLRRAQHP